MFKLFSRKKRGREIELDEILLDSSNLPSFNKGRMEGRLELPLAKRGVMGVGIVFTLIAILFLGQLFKLQVIEGSAYAEQSRNNKLDSTLIFAERGIVYDRNEERLAWNKSEVNQSIAEFPERAYTDRRGFGQLLGYVNYPRKDSSGYYFRTEYIGRGGVEEAYNGELSGENGEQLIEVDALGSVISENIVHEPEHGDSLTLSIDARLSEAINDLIATSAARVGFRSGAAAIMDVHTGEIIALASNPSFDPEILTSGSDPEVINGYSSDDRLPLLNKVVAGVYTPGSIVKPFLALAALAEKIIDPNKIIVSRGAITVPNPYDPGHPSVFVDWRPGGHGELDMRKAIAVSSNEYFYHVGGGYGDQEGLGITKINEYMHKFGFGEYTGIELPGELAGTVPNPEWKREIFDDDWRLGDTYHTSIGQFGFQVTPVQMLRAYAAIANGGILLKPTVIKGSVTESVDLKLDQDDLRVIHEGMRQGAIEGTARALNRSDIHFAGKTGTAELGVNKEFVNSWVTGFFPYEEPRYAFVLLMEHGPRANLFGAAPVMSQVVAWMVENTPEYLFPEGK